MTAPEEVRDPTVPFDVASSSLTGTTSAAVEPPAPTQPVQLSTGSAWDAAHAAQAGPRPAPAWGPELPVELPERPVMDQPAPAQYPPPQVNPQQFPDQQYWPPPEVPQRNQPRPVSVREIAAATTPGVLIALALGALFVPLSIALLFIAHALASRVLYRRRSVDRAFKITESITAVIAAAQMFGDGYGLDFAAFWSYWQGWAQLGNLVLIPVAALLVGAGLRAGEKPARTL
ncbi:hypothetical protein [Nigerium massiliense]|uniref:hypothetical protein n=1 Tax=Nigerium massiliense TaxID=1522317 RepID=UPI00058AEA06|nr:hypothetical protein [Nigerium massiliense]